VSLGLIAEPRGIIMLLLRATGNKKYGADPKSPGGFVRESGLVALKRLMYVIPIVLIKSQRRH
jgi:hypothetical protein